MDLNVTFCNYMAFHSVHGRRGQDEQGQAVIKSQMTVEVENW